MTLFLSQDLLFLKLSFLIMKPIIKQQQKLTIFHQIKLLLPLLIHLLPKLLSLIIHLLLQSILIHPRQLIFPQLNQLNLIYCQLQFSELVFLLKLLSILQPNQLKPRNRSLRKRKLKHSKLKVSRNNLFKTLQNTNQ